MKKAYTELEYDLLREIFNIAMGRAGAALARLLKEFVDLSVPEVRIVEAEKVVESVIQHSVFSDKEKIICFHQLFSNPHMDGEAVNHFQ